MCNLNPGVLITRTATPAIDLASSLARIEILSGAIFLFAQGGRIRRVLPGFRTSS